MSISTLKRIYAGIGYEVHLNVYHVVELQYLCTIQPTYVFFMVSVYSVTLLQVTSL